MLILRNTHVQGFWARFFILGRTGTNSCTKFSPLMQA